jgi:hypothetical protein
MTELARCGAGRRNASSDSPDPSFATRLHTWLSRISQLVEGKSAHPLPAFRQRPSHHPRIGRSRRSIGRADIRA